MSLSLTPPAVTHVLFIFFGWSLRWVVGGHTAAVLWNVFSMICLIELAASLCN